jgi:hypothetical protein
MNDLRIGSRVQIRDLHSKGQQQPIKDSSTGTIVHIEIGQNCDGDDQIEYLNVFWDEGGEIEKVDDWFDLLDVTPRLFVNFYIHDRAYGGAEEGGWYYDVYSPQYDISKRYDTQEEAMKAFEQAKDEVKEHNLGRYDIGSVLSDGEYVVYLEGYPGQGSPTRRPYYC